MVFIRGVPTVPAARESRVTACGQTLALLGVRGDRLRAVRPNTPSVPFRYQTRRAVSRSATPGRSSIRPARICPVQSLPELARPRDYRSDRNLPDAIAIASLVNSA